MGPPFSSLLGIALDQIRHNADGNVAVLMRLLSALTTLAGRTSDPVRRAAICLHRDLVTACADRTITVPYDRARVELEVQRFAREMRRTDQSAEPPVPQQ